MLNFLIRLLRTASIVICLIVIVSFVVFAADRTKTASGHQREELTGQTATTVVKQHENGVHEALEEASSSLTSPFAGLVSDASSEWAERGARLLLALLVYGFGLGYIARVMRVRV